MRDKANSFAEEETQAKIRTAVSKFNNKPQQVSHTNMVIVKGIDYLVSVGVMSGKAEEVARFVLTDNLKMDKIGDYLGEK